MSADPAGLAVRRLAADILDNVLRRRRPLDEQLQDKLQEQDLARQDLARQDLARQNLARQNVLVELTAAGKTRSRPYFANAMDVRLLENYGQIRATEAAGGKTLAKVYVKVYARLADGSVKFHKDGYTDHRGRFDYASVSTPDRQPISRFAILVLSEDKGALIREAAPPQQ
jgi:hypothetical protein